MSTLNNICRALLILTCSMALTMCKEKSLSGETKESKTTTIVKTPITNEIAGSSYRKRALSYQLINLHDTSDVVAIVTESKEGGKVSILFSGYRTSKAWEQRLQDLKLILPEIRDDFNMDSLQSIHLGRLVTNGDVAIDVTDDFFSDPNNKVVNNITVAKAMLSSQLAHDFNTLLENDSLYVKGFSLEKCHLTSRDILLWEGKVTRDSTLIPDKIIDCLTYVEVASRRSSR